MIGFSIEKSAENIQILTLFYSSCIMVFTDKISKLLKVNGIGRIFSISVVATFPYLIMTAGAVNNDCLMTILTVIAIYYTLKWYENPNFKNIILIAILIGTAMMTKISAVLIAPAIAMLFLVKLTKDRINIVSYVKQFFIFGLISFPLGLWYPIKNKILFGVPLNYVPKASKNIAQYIGDYALWTRFFDFSKDQFHQLNVCGFNDKINSDHNIFISLVKYSTFGEEAYYLKNNLTKSIGSILFWVVTLTIIVAIIWSIYWLIRSKTQNEIKIFFLLITLVIMSSYMIFCISYPFICTMNVRYILIAILMLMICAGAGISQYMDQSSSVIKVRFIRKVLIIWGFLFGVISTLNYLLFFIVA
jgi:hypothetical protein